MRAFYNFLYFTNFTERRLRKESETSENSNTDSWLAGCCLSCERLLHSAK
ncbi:hypothetical protein EVA_05667 [gut metagenome]|uniref:Uncharacterized protein n=1 Tax=gut metagenome TaxID=749906 RepID=J9GZ83_9ZZZZ